LHGAFPFSIFPWSLRLAAALVDSAYQGMSRLTGEQTAMRSKPAVKAGVILATDVPTKKILATDAQESGFRRKTISPDREEMTKNYHICAERVS
jgi:hypothetical protein